MPRVFLRAPHITIANLPKKSEFASCGSVRHSKRLEYPGRYLLPAVPKSVWAGRLWLVGGNPRPRLLVQTPTGAA